MLLWVLKIIICIAICKYIILPLWALLLTWIFESFDDESVWCATVSWIVVLLIWIIFKLTFLIVIAVLVAVGTFFVWLWKKIKNKIENISLERSLRKAKEKKEKEEYVEIIEEVKEKPKKAKKAKAEPATYVCWECGWEVTRRHKKCPHCKAELIRK